MPSSSYSLLFPPLPSRLLLLPPPSFKSQSLSLLSLPLPHRKIAQLTNNAPAIPHLGIPAYNWLNDDEHGGRGVVLYIYIYGCMHTFYNFKKGNNKYTRYHFLFVCRAFESY